MSCKDIQLATAVSGYIYLAIIQRQETGGLGVWSATEYVFVIVLGYVFMITSRYSYLIIRQKL